MGQAVATGTELYLLQQMRLCAHHNHFPGGFPRKAEAERARLAPELRKRGAATNRLWLLPHERQANHGLDGTGTGDCNC